MITFINNSLERAVQALEFLAANPRPSGGNQQFNSEDLYQIARELKISVDNAQEKWYIDRMKEEIEMARQYLEKEKNGTLDLENLSEDEKQMRIFSEAYDKSGLAEIVTNHPEYLRCINALCRHAQCFEPTQEMVDIAISHAERMIDAEKEFENAVIEIAGGENQVEDFKFFAPDMQNPDELLKAATQMLNGEGNELRKC